MHADYLSDPLWLKLEAMEMDEPDVPVPFTERMKCETGLPDGEVREAIAEYKKFIYVATVRGIAPVMPLRAERIWVTHLTYSRHYWNYMCAEILGIELHHLSAMELAERDGTENHATASIEAYEAVFGTAPPARLDHAINEPKESWLKPITIFCSLVIVGIITNGQAIVPAVFAIVLGIFLKDPIGAWSTARYRVNLPITLSPEDKKVLHALQTIDIESLGAAGEPLIAQLMKATEWNDKDCRKAIAAYRQFLFVKYMAQHKVTPSPQIDKVWHLHMSHSDHYWNELCGRILKQPFHHNPASGRPGEWARFRDQYLRTIATYERLFGEMPPPDMWPREPSISEIRSLWAGLAIAVTGACLHTIFSLDPVWLTIVAVAPIVILAAATAYRWPINDAAVTRKDFKLHGSGQWEISAGSCGGCGGCGG